MKNLIWLASFPKSGNTWTRAFISSMLGFGTISEQGGFQKFSSSCSSKVMWPTLFPAGTAPAVDMSMAWRAQYQRALSEKLGRQQHFCKTHSRYGSVVGNPMFAPEVSARAVVIVRNPFDVAASMANYLTTTLENGIAVIANPLLTFNNKGKGQNRISVGSWDINVISWVTQRDIPLLILRYEDLHADPMTGFGRLAREVLGIDDEARVKKAVDDASFDNLKEKEEKYGFEEARSAVNPFFNKGYPYYSLQEFSPEQKTAIWLRHRSVAEAMGYRFDGETVTLEPIDMEAMMALVPRYEPFINAASVQA